MKKRNFIIKSNKIMKTSFFSRNLLARTILFVSILSFTSCERHDSQISVVNKGSPLPTFEMLLDSSTIINISSLPSEVPIYILYFNPYCPFCRAETKELLKNSNIIDHSLLIFLSSFPLNSIKQFKDEFNLSKYKSIIVAQDYQQAFMRKHNVKWVPYLVKYDTQKLEVDECLGFLDAKGLTEI